MPAASYGYGLIKMLRGTCCDLAHEVTAIRRMNQDGSTGDKVLPIYQGWREVRHDLTLAP
jgi:hypothetical protein